MSGTRKTPTAIHTSVPRSHSFQSTVRAQSVSPGPTDVCHDSYPLFSWDSPGLRGSHCPASLRD